MPAAEIALPGEASSARGARRFLAATLAGWSAMGYDDAILVVSELVANAALHARTGLVVQIELRADCLRIAVTDGSPRQPVVRHYGAQSTTGRGLGLVSAMARSWGIDAHPDGSKTVWAEMQSEGHDEAVDAVNPTVDTAARSDRAGGKPFAGPTAGYLRAA